MKEKLEELQKQYAGLVAEYGDRHFKIVREQLAIDQLKAKMIDLDQQYFKLVDEEKAKEKLQEESKDVNN